MRITAGQPGGKTWWRNVLDPQPRNLHLAGRTHTAVAHVERDGGKVAVLAQLAAPEE